MMCPTCQIPLAMTDREGVEIDYCAQCRGVWLDRGELDKIIERSARESAPPRTAVGLRSHSDDRGGYRSHDDDRSYRGKRKKFFLEQIFD